ncbi:MAG: hypothetical protein EPN91_02365 [Salinibacterium sp.]|nr:MAG: hypothetical protein EPN91_02365 [Salinibacterium sp.]
MKVKTIPNWPNRESFVVAEHRSLLTAMVFRGRRAVPILWVNHVGFYRHLHGEGVIQMGQDGYPDLVGTLYGGWSFYCETKRPKNSKTTQEQLAFGEIAKAVGAFHCISSSAVATAALVLKFLEEKYALQSQKVTVLTSQTSSGASF